VSQHTPSTQKPFAQSAGELQVPPGGFFGSQRPLLQNALSLQSANVVHTVVHAPLVHRNAPHGTVESLRQVPEPSQV
jgi:hypothetical protein